MCDLSLTYLSFDFAYVWHNAYIKERNDKNV